MSYSFIEQVNLTIVNQHLRHVINHRHLDLYSPHLSIHFLTEKTAEHMVMELHHQIAAQKLDNIVIKTPASWWEHLKEEKLAKWRITRWYVEKNPVKYGEHRYDIKIHYPDVALPEERHYFQVTKLTYSPFVYPGAGLPKE